MNIYLFLIFRRIFSRYNYIHVMTMIRQQIFTGQYIIFYIDCVEIISKKLINTQECVLSCKNCNQFNPFSVFRSTFKGI